MSCTYTFNNKDYTKEDLITQLSVYNIDLVNQVTNIGLQNASKIVDENGEPLVVYHGTNTNFTEFNTIEGSNRKSKMQLLFGNHFASLKKDAELYTKNQNIISSFIALKKPLDLSKGYTDKKDANFQKWLQVVYELKLDKKNKNTLDYTLFTENGDFGGKSTQVERVFINATTLDTLPPNKVYNALLNAGFDGVIYTPYQPQGFNQYTNFSQSFITLTPNQIKSATEIKGVTTEDTNDIRYLTKRPQYNNTTKQFVGNYNYLTEDYVSDFYIEQLKEKQKNSAKYRNFYSNFEVNEKGINLLNTDDITMQQIEIYADDNLRQYSLISKQIPDLQVDDINENPRDLVVNNPKTLENYKKDLFRVNEDTIILKDSVETFIKVNDEIYENVEVKGNLSTFAKIKTEKSDYYQYNIKQPKTNIKLSDYNYLSTQEELFTSPKKYLKQEEKNQIKNDKFNC